MHRCREHGPASTCSLLGLTYTAVVADAHSLEFGIRRHFRARHYGLHGPGASGFPGSLTSTTSRWLESFFYLKSAPYGHSGSWLICRVYIFSHKLIIIREMEANYSQSTLTTRAVGKLSRYYDIELCMYNCKLRPVRLFAGKIPPTSYTYIQLATGHIL